MFHPATAYPGHTSAVPKMCVLVRIHRTRGTMPASLYGDEGTFHARLFQGGMVNLRLMKRHQWVIRAVHMKMRGIIRVTCKRRGSAGLGLTV